jgi:quinone-modifying oxidoreductase subunit QmoC
MRIRHIFITVGLYYGRTIRVLTFFPYLLPDGPIHGPWFQLNPIKWLANIAGVALIVGYQLDTGHCQR